MDSAYPHVIKVMTGEGASYVAVGGHEGSRRTLAEQYAAAQKVHVHVHATLVGGDFGFDVAPNGENTSSPNSFDYMYGKGVRA